MDSSLVLEFGREALITALVICGPVLAIGLIVGLVLSLLQAVTQIQDQTLSIVPKIVAMVVAGVFFIPWLAQHVVEYTRSVFAGP